MKFACQSFCIALLTAAVWAQNATPAPEPPDSSMAHTHQHGTPGHTMPGQNMSGQTMPEMKAQLPEMKAQVEKMRATLDQMKANLHKIKRPGLLQQHAQFDLDLWEAMTQHMESMVKMMAQQPEMPMEQAMGGMSCCDGMAKDAAGKCMHGQSGAKPVPSADQN